MASAVSRQRDSLHYLSPEQVNSCQLLTLQAPLAWLGASHAGAAKLEMLLHLPSIPRHPWAAPGTSILCRGRRGLNQVVGWELGVCLELQPSIFSSAVSFAQVP